MCMHEPLQAKYERKMKMLRDDMELRRKHELHEARATGLGAARLPCWPRVQAPWINAEEAATGGPRRCVPAVG